MTVDDLFAAHPWPWTLERMTVYDAVGQRVSELAGNPGQVAVTLAAAYQWALEAIEALQREHREREVERIERAGEAARE